MVSLFYLPTDVLRTHVFTHLDEKDLAHLDGATTNRIMRHKMLLAFNGLILLGEDSGIIIIDTFCKLNWILLRKVRLSAIKVTIDISLGKGIDNNVFEATSILARLSPQLQFLGFGSLVHKRCRVDDAVLFEFANHCFFLKGLVIENCEGFLSDGVLELIRCSPSLRALCISSSCPECVNNAILYEVSRCCPELVYLKLSQDSDVIDESNFIEMIKHCKHLTRVDISDCQLALTDLTLDAFSEYCPALQSLYLTDDVYSAVALRNLRMKCEGIQIHFVTTDGYMQYELEDL